MSFFRWLKDLSTKQTIVIAIIVLTLFSYVERGIAMTTSTGNIAGLYVNLFAWLVTAITVFIIISIVLLISYGISKLRHNEKDGVSSDYKKALKKQKKQEKQDKKEAIKQRKLKDKQKNNLSTIDNNNDNENNKKS